MGKRSDILSLVEAANSDATDIVKNAWGLLLISRWSRSPLPAYGFFVKSFDLVTELHASLAEIGDLLDEAAKRTFPVPIRCGDFVSTSAHRLTLDVAQQVKLTVPIDCEPSLENEAQVCRYEIEDLFKYWGQIKPALAKIDFDYKWLVAALKAEFIEAKCIIQERDDAGLLAADHRQNSGDRENTDHEYVFRKFGANFRVRFESESGDIPARLTGAQYLHILLRSPDKPMSAFDLQQEIRVRKRLHSAVSSSDHDRLLGQHSPTDPEKLELKRGLKDHLRQLAEERGKAIEDNDAAKLEAIDDEYEQIEQYVASHFGLGGRVRPEPGDPLDKARVAVRKALTRLFDKCDSEYGLPKLAQHLETTIETGAEVCYRPPDASFDWTLF